MSIADIKAGDKVYVVRGHALLPMGDIRTVKGVVEAHVYLQGDSSEGWHLTRFLRVAAVGDVIPMGSVVRTIYAGRLGKQAEITHCPYEPIETDQLRVIVSAPDDAKAAKIKELEQTLEQAQAQLRELRD